MVGKVYFAFDYDRELRAAMALFDCEEDMTDENISDHIFRGCYPASRFAIRDSWEQLVPQTREAYLRRARAVLAAADYPERKRPEPEL